MDYSDQDKAKKLSNAIQKYYDEKQLPDATVDAILAKSVQKRRSPSIYYWTSGLAAALVMGVLLWQPHPLLTWQPKVVDAEHIAPEPSSQPPVPDVEAVAPVVATIDTSEMISERQPEAENLPPKTMAKTEAESQPPPKKPAPPPKPKPQDPVVKNPQPLGSGGSYGIGPGRP